MTSYDTSSTGSKLTAFVMSLLVTAPMMIFDGYVVMKLWNWFIPPVFTGAPTLGIGTGIGVSLVVAFLTHEPQDDGKGLWESLVYSVFMGLFRGGLFLIMGAIVHGIIS